MADDANPWPTQAEDEARLRALAADLAAAVDAHLAGWVERVVEERATAWAGYAAPELRAAAVAAGRAATADIGPQARAVLESDIDEQAVNPLAVLRGAVSYPTAVLRDAGVPLVARDPFVARAFPDDVYDLSPATWADVDPALHEPGLAWGAAKAFVFKARRRVEGRR